MKSTIIETLVIRWCYKSNQKTVTMIEKAKSKHSSHNSPHDIWQRRNKVSNDKYSEKYKWSN